VGIRLAEGPDPVAALDPDLAQAARGIGVAVAMRLRELAPAIRPAGAAGEPDLVIEEITLDPEDPLDPVTLLACISAHDAYVSGRGRSAGASPGALAIARLLTWATRAEALGRAPRITWIGPPSRRPDDIPGHVVSASVRLSGADGAVRAAAVAIVA